MKDTWKKPKSGTSLFLFWFTKLVDADFSDYSIEIIAKNEQVMFLDDIRQAETFIEGSSLVFDVLLEKDEFEDIQIRLYGPNPPAVEEGEEPKPAREPATETIINVMDLTDNNSQQISFKPVENNRKELKMGVLKTSDAVSHIADLPSCDTSESG